MQNEFTPEQRADAIIAALQVPTSQLVIEIAAKFEAVAHSAPADEKPEIEALVRALRERSEAFRT